MKLLLIRSTVAAVSGAATAALAAPPTDGCSRDARDLPIYRFTDDNHVPGRV